MLTIESNGSKWAGQEPDDLETLYECLTTYKLDWTFAPFAHTVADNLPCTEVDRIPFLAQVRFFGNFEEFSHVFSIVTDDEKICKQLISAIKANYIKFGC